MNLGLLWSLGDLGPLGGCPDFLAANAPLSLTDERWTNQGIAGRGVDGLQVSTYVCRIVVTK